MGKVEHSEESDAVQSMIRSVGTNEHPHWLGVFISIDEEGNLHLDRTTWKFPRERMGEAIGKIASDLFGELLPPPTEEKMETLSLEDYRELQKRLAGSPLKAPESKVGEFLTGEEGEECDPSNG